MSVIRFLSGHRVCAPSLLCKREWVGNTAAPTEGALETLGCFWLSRWWGVLALSRQFGPLHSRNPYLSFSSTDQLKAAMISSSVHSCSVPRSQKVEAPKRPSASDWLKKLWCVHTVEYPLATRRGGALTPATTWTSKALCQVRGARHRGPPEGRPRPGRDRRQAGVRGLDGRRWGMSGRCDFMWGWGKCCRTRRRVVASLWLSWVPLLCLLGNSSF